MWKMQFLPFHHCQFPIQPSKPAGMQDKAGNQGEANSLEVTTSMGKWMEMEWESQ